MDAATVVVVVEVEVAGGELVVVVELVEVDRRGGTDQETTGGDKVDGATSAGTIRPETGTA